MNYIVITCGCGYSTFPGLQGRSVRSCSGTSTGDNSRLLADGLGTEQLLYNNADQYYREGPG